MSGFNPFGNKTLSELQGSDLALLKSVSEGWYVEYKESTNGAKNIAKSISSFANQYGGWIFYGAKETKDGQNMLASCPGIAAEELDATHNLIRQTAASSLSPVPHFELRAINGPVPQVDLPEGRFVYCVYVPKSNLTPHIHNSGRIYRRVADSSNPVAETDRHQLDLLWRRNELFEEEYKQWVYSDAKSLVQEAKGAPLLRVLIDSGRTPSTSQRWTLTNDRIFDILNDEAIGSTIPVDSCYSSSRGIIARQTRGNDRHSRVAFTVILKEKLRAEFWLPLHLSEGCSFEKLPENIQNYKYAKEFQKILAQQKVTDGKLIDLNKTLNNLIAISNQLLVLLKENESIQDTIHYKIMLQNIGGVIPAVDLKPAMEKFEKLGLPLTLFDQAEYPSGAQPANFITIERSQETLNPFHIGIHMMMTVFHGFGLGNIFDCTKDEGIKLVEEMLGVTE